MNDLTIHI